MKEQEQLEIQSWKDCRKGETAWILGSGPSLDELDPNVVSPNRFALNLTILMEDWRDSWWVCRDGRCLQKWLGSVHRKCFGEDRREVETLITDAVGARRIEKLDIGYDKIRRVVNTRKRFFTGETILVFALQVADYIGFSDIVLAGVDLCDPGGVAYAKEIDWQSKFTLQARGRRYKRMRDEVLHLSTTLNARVRTVSPHLEDIFERADV